MSSTQPGKIDETRRHLHYVLRMGNPEPVTPMLDSVERWNWAVRISVVGLFVIALVVIAMLPHVPRAACKRSLHRFSRVPKGR